MQDYKPYTGAAPRMIPYTLCLLCFGLSGSRDLTPHAAATLSKAKRLATGILFRTQRRPELRSQVEGLLGGPGYSQLAA